MLGACDATIAAAGGDVGDGGHSCIWLHVRASDEAAQKLYEGNGYVEVGRDKQPGFFRFGGAPVPKPRVLMKKQL
jgi:ribosomal protein S18 acetylase RimI-like enzyme